MIEWFTYVQIAVAVIAGLIAVVRGLAGKIPSDLVLGSLAVVEVLLIAQLVISIVAPFAGNEASGSTLEFFVYLISALLLPIAAGFWALIERSRWSTIILGVASLAVAVMLDRMLQIWTVQGV